VLQCAAVRCSVLQRVAACCSVKQQYLFEDPDEQLRCVAVSRSVLQ